jgi:DNA-binding beta-propeller fold protein YncE
VSTIDYRTLNVRIQALHGDRYKAIVRGPDGDGQAEFDLVFGEGDLDELAAAVGRPRSARRRIESDESARAREFGGALFELIFKDTARDVLRAALAQARRENLGLRLLLQLDGARQLRNVPWELLWDSPRFISTSAYTPVLRYVDIPARPLPLALTPPLRILGMVSSPADMPALDSENEREHLANACRSLTERGLLEINWVEQATLAGLLKRLNERDHHIFHFIGHGDFDEEAEDGVLLFEGRAGRSHRVTGVDLATILADQHTLRLAVINACEGARVALDSNGVAANLMQYGLPAVIAMQFEISDEAAIAFAAHFYGSVARNRPIDEALADARRGMFADGHGLEWATPVLFTSIADGRLFEVGLGADDLSEPIPIPIPEPEPVDERSEELEAEPTEAPGGRDRDGGGGGVMRPRTMAILGVALVSILVVVLVVAGVFSGSSALRYGKEIHVGEAPVGVTLASDRVWVANQQADEITSIDPRTGAIDEQVHVNGQPNSIAIDLHSGYIWVVSISNGSITVLRPGPGSSEVRPVAEFTIKGKPNAIVLGFGKAWVTDSEDETVNEIDERSVTERGLPEITPIEEVGERLSGIAVGKRYVWVASAGDAVIRMNPNKEGFISIPVKYGISGIAVQEGQTEEEAVWVSNLRDKSVSRIVPNEKSGEVVGSPIHVGREPKGIAPTPDGIWVASAGSGEASWIAVTPTGDRDPGKDRSISLAGQPNAVAVGLKAVWVTNVQTNSVTPLAP